ncbi:MAG: dTDP-glucose 4,6-dehydratase [Phototrophicaceae bacterium]
MKNILVTGAAGFIGSEFVRILATERPDLNVISFDKLTYAGNTDNLLPLKDVSNHTFVQGDIADLEGVRGVFDDHQVDTVVNFAAESHVDRSILDPEAFIRTDVFGVYRLLEASRQHGIGRFMQVSTDEVYGDVEEGFSVESDPFLPNSPYASSKASGELLVRSYHVTYGMDTVVSRGSNTYGPYQYPEKLIPLFITEALEDRSLPVYGDGLQVRDWLHVEDHARGVMQVLFEGKSGESYNIAGEDVRTNIEVIKLLLQLMDKPESLIRYVRDREGHDRRYAMNADKAIQELGWQRRHTFEEGLAQTIAWYKSNDWWWRKIKTGEYLEYYKQQYAERLSQPEE